MGNVSTVEQKKLEKVTEFYKEEAQKVEIAKKIEAQEKERKDTLENIKLINKDWLGEVPTFQEAGNPFG
jgi:16S rRNA C1402 N4-methylase RsmH